MVIWILDFGEGTLAVNYLIFTTVASFGVLQFVAGSRRLVGLMLFPARLSRWLGVALVAGSYLWFFTVQPDLLIPGLAGGEFFTLFFAGFVIASFVSIGLGIVANRFSGIAIDRLPNQVEPIVLTGGARGQLWLPDHAVPPLVIAMREASTDSLNVLGSELVKAGAAVLMCDAAAAEGAVKYADKHAERFHPTRLYALGVGRGGDQVLQLAREDKRFRSVLALAPFGRSENMRPGLRWLRETDYLEALSYTFKPRISLEGEAPSSACVVYGDEDTLVPPTLARLIFPSALMVAGARHFTLARAPAAARLAVDLFDLQPGAVGAPAPVTAATSAIQGGLGE